MPNYSYKCSDCDHTFEAFQSMSATPLNECPKCRGEIKRLIGGGAGLVFKGSGFYQTDYKKSSVSAKPCEGGSSDACASCPKADS